MTRSTRSDNDDSCGKVRTKTKIKVDNIKPGGGNLDLETYFPEVRK